MEELNITWAYPDILNLHGDRGNIMALERIAKQMKITPNIKRINQYEEKIDFENTDILFFNPGELKVMPSIIQALKEQKEALDQYIEQGKTIIVIGTTGCIMAKETKRINGEIIQGLGYLDMTCEEREKVYGDDIHFKLKEGEQEIIGCQIQMIDTKIKEDIALGTIIYGMGNQGDGTEGAKYKNVIFTNALGPVLVKNPWYTEALIRQAMEVKGYEKRNTLDFSLEEKSLACIKKFIEEKEKVPCTQK